MYVPGASAAHAGVVPGHTIVSPSENPRDAVMNVALPSYSARSRSPSWFWNEIAIVVAIVPIGTWNE